jgi:hypothetical protein
MHNSSGLLSAREADVLDGLEVSLREAHTLKAPWRVRAAIVEGAAVVLQAMEDEGDAS